MRFNAKGVRGDKSALYFEFPLPCIAHVIVNGNLSHYVVIHKITKKRKLLLHIFFASLIYTILGILGAFYFKVLVDDILPDGLKTTLFTLSVGVILLNIFRVLLNSFRTHLLLNLSQKLDIVLLLGYYRHVLELPMNFFGTRKIGEIISRFNDASKVRDAISGATLTMMIDTLMALSGAIILYMQNVVLFGVALTMVLLYTIIVFAFQKLYKKMNETQMEDNAQLTAYLVESLNGIQTIKSYNAERKVNLSIESKFIKFLKSIFNLGMVENIQGSLKTMIELIGGVVILWIGGIYVIAGDMTIGQLVTFNSLLMYFLDPIKNLINLQPQMQTALVAADRLGEILDLEAEKTEQEYKKMNPESLVGDIEFKHVDFRYGTRKLVLEDINIKIEKGQKVAFVGESGSGKTTLSKLLLHLYSAEKGEILINGNNIEDIQIEKLREKIAYIPQETFLFSGSILENLSLGLDYATSNLDAITERALDKTIHEFSKDMTTIFIAHRLSTIKNCDKIFVMEQGKIIESGTHEELRKAGGKYAELVKQQSLEEHNGKEIAGGVFA